jgi:hypothetical protein
LTIIVPYFSLNTSNNEESTTDLQNTGPGLDNWLTDQIDQIENTPIEHIETNENTKSELEEIKLQYKQLEQKMQEELRKKDEQLEEIRQQLQTLQFQNSKTNTIEKEQSQKSDQESTNQDEDSNEIKGS